MPDRRRFITGIASVSTVGVVGCVDIEEESELERKIPLSVSGSYGPETQSELEWEDNKLTFEAGDVDPEEHDFENLVEATLILSTESPIDMSSVAKIKYSFRHTSTGGRQDTSLLALSRDRWDIEYHSVKYHVGEAGEYVGEEDINNAASIEKALFVKDKNDTQRVNESFDVRDLFREQYIGFGVNCGAADPQEMTLEVFDLYGVDDTDERIFELDFSNERISPI